MHLGHYVGTLANRVRLQDEYECFFIIADLHTLTTRPQKEHIESIKDNIREMVLDYLSVGIDPARSCVYLQSAVHEVYELNLFFEMLVNVPRLQRMPSLKDMAKNAHLNEMPYGLLGYPVLQAADILMVRADGVPVGEDQLPHLELTREIVRRFNFLYGETFGEPQSLLSPSPRIPGTDGRKMSKSYGNSIWLTDPPQEIEKKVMSMITDPARRTRKDPGDPDKCSAFQLHKVYSVDILDDIAEKCRSAGRGCVECKGMLAERVVESLLPFQERRAELGAKPGYAWEVLERGLGKVKPVAREVLRDVRARMGID